MPVNPDKVRRLIAERPYRPDAPKEVRPKQALVPLSPPSTRVASLPCIHLGNRTRPPEGQSPLKEWYNCEAGKGVVCKCSCGPNKCDRYTADAEQQVKTGVVIGHYDMPDLIDLQIRVLRDTCGPVPVLVHDDHSPSQSRLRAICDRHNVEVVQSGLSNIGHAGGDLGAFYKGLVWAKKNGIEVLCKLSQRFIPIRPDWLNEGAAALLTSGLSTLTDACIEGRNALPLRTEAILLKVDRWTQDRPLKLVRPRRVFPYSGEAIVAQALSTIGGGFGVWPFLGGPDRTRRNPNYLWHTCNTVADYKALADRYGVHLDDTFFVAGWAKNTQEDWG